VRAASGGLLFGAPLLFTMEVWWTGSHTDPMQMAAVILLGSLPLFVLNKTEGFRSQRDVRTIDAATDTIEALAVGLVVATTVLLVLNEISTATPLAEGLGKVIYESVPFCLGVGLGRHLLHGARAGGDDGDGGGDSGGDTGADTGDDQAGPAGLADVGAATLGAAFLALTIAPTDEVPMIASQTTPGRTLVFMAFSLVASYAIVFVADFGGQEARSSDQGPFQAPLTETVVCYLVALVVAALLLWMFQRGVDSRADFLTRVVVLGLPASIGGAAGRLAV
jgi:putative integral membrane protein (TIGR02587 family)